MVASACLLEKRQFLPQNKPEGRKIHNPHCWSGLQFVKDGFLILAKKTEDTPDYTHYSAVTVRGWVSAVLLVLRQKSATSFCRTFLTANSVVQWQPRKRRGRGLRNQ
jgi:hypothetical protein